MLDVLRSRSGTDRSRESYLFLGALAMPDVVYVLVDYQYQSNRSGRVGLCARRDLWNRTVVAAYRLMDVFGCRTEFSRPTFAAAV
jgi:hypothetical protein